MAEHITKCARCGSQRFIIVETVDWDGEVDDASFLGCRNAWSTIESIRCVECDASYAADSFAQIDFN